MRGETNDEKIRALMQRLGRAATSPGRVYFTGGATAVLHGWRPTTVDADLKLDPEPAGVFAAMARIKDELDINIELASPDGFIPPLPGWREHSDYIDTVGSIDFYHYDYRAQALAKIERALGYDLPDVRAMLDRRLIDLAALREAFAAIEPELARYPSIDADVFRSKVEAFLEENGDDD